MRIMVFIGGAAAAHLAASLIKNYIIDVVCSYLFGSTHSYLKFLLDK